MTIGRKIGVCVGTLVVLCFVVGAVGWVSISALGNHLDKAVGSTARKIELAGEMKVNVLTFRLQERGMLLFSMINSADQVVKCRDAYEKAIGSALDKAQVIRPLLATERGRQLMDQAESAVREYKVQQLEVRNLLAAGKVSEATESDKKMLVPIGGRISTALDQYTELLHRFNAAAAEEAASTRSNARLLLALGLLACVPISLAVGVVILRMTRQLQTVASDLHETAGQMASAAGQVASSSQALAQGSSEQAASLEETSASSEEINSMACRNTENSRSAAAMMTDSQQKFVQTNQSLEEMEVAMGEIKTSSGKVSKIIKVIDEIAFQTNILALNAAVEAARAGEAGAGFAVVADEVRNLAQRCALAAKDTSSLLEESLTKSNHGMTKVGQVAVAIRIVTEQSAVVKGLMDDVSTGSQEQARGMEQITKAIAQMEQVTQSTAAAAEESASASEELSTQADGLRGVVETLTLMVGGGK
jgi:methyl-accepting chemotaxis protein